MRNISPTGAQIEEITMIQKFNRWLAKFQLSRRYKYLIEVDKLMEEFTTESILNGGSNEFIAASRKQLVVLQNDIKAKERLLAFLQK